MDSILRFGVIALIIAAHFVSSSYCTDKMFVTEVVNTEILMAEAIDYSFVNTTFIKLPLNDLVFPVGVEFDPRSEMIYWTDAVLHTVNRARLDGSSQEVIVQLTSVPGDKHYPYGIALNLDDNKVYWADQYRDVIQMANLDGTNRVDLLMTGFNSYPYAIVYSSFRRKIYWTDRGQYAKIEMANPDGTDRETLLDADIDSSLTDPTALCLDSAERRLYWTDTTVDRIENLNLDNRQRFISFWTSSQELDLNSRGIAKYFEDIYFSDINYNGVYALDFPEGNVSLVNRVLPTPAEIHIHADISCPGNNLCAITGTCVLTSRQPDVTYSCICDKGYTGNHCETDISCPGNNSCATTGTCVLTSRQPDVTYSCICDEGYTGNHCETDINDCVPNPCMNGGTCTDGVASFTCDCVAGYTDSTCSTGFTRAFKDINNCVPNPCMNRGTCTDGIASFTCDCVAGYTDSTCSTDINNCVPNPCINGGTCTDGVASFTCDCVAGYTDSTCSTAIDQCAFHNACGINEYCTITDMAEVGYFCNCYEGLERRKGVCMASRSVGGSVTFTRLNGQLVSFTNALYNPTSEEYGHLEGICSKILHRVISDIMSTHSYEWEIEITGFSPGTIVDFHVKVFDVNRTNLNSQAADMETSLGLQQPGVWQSSSVSLTVESVTSYGEICLNSPCSNGMCITSPGEKNYSCICQYGYTGQHCETEITCPLPNHPHSHVEMPESSYRADDVIIIKCDDKEGSVVWRCNGTSGDWIHLADLDCKPGDESRGISTGAIVCIVIAVAVVLITGMVLCFRYKMANRNERNSVGGVIWRVQ